MFNSPFESLDYALVIDPDNPDEVLELENYLTNVHSSEYIEEVYWRSLLGQVFLNHYGLLQPRLNMFEPFDFSSDESIAVLLERMGRWLLEKAMTTSSGTFNHIPNITNDFSRVFSKTFMGYAFSRQWANWAGELIEEIPRLGWCISGSKDTTRFKNLLPKTQWSAARQYELFSGRSNFTSAIIYNRMFLRRLKLILRIFPLYLPPYLPAWTNNDFVPEKEEVDRYWTWSRLRNSLPEEILTKRSLAKLYHTVRLDLESIAKEVQKWDDDLTTKHDILNALIHNGYCVIFFHVNTINL
ncbi:MAG: hypothetical protein ACTSRK_07500 [Promethearchaeota archaeon]